MPALLQDVGNWPVYDSAQLEGKNRTLFLARERAMRLYVSFRPLAEVLKAAKASPERWRKMFLRCGQLKADGSIVGWEGLVPGRQIGPRIRSAKVVPDRTGKAGYAGAFGQLLRDKPQIPKELVIYLNAYGTKALRPNKVTFRTLHRRFVQICVDAGVKADEYPLNTRERCRKALRKWIDEVYMAKHSNRFIRLEYGVDAGKLNAYGEGTGDAEGPPEPYSSWTLDEVTVDVHARYEVPAASGDWNDLDLGRFFQLRMRDRSSGATLSVRHVFAVQANADDVAILFWDAINGPPEVPHAVPGLLPMDGAGYPSVVIKELRYAIPKIIYLDNALAHLAGHAQYIALKLLNAVVVLGPPGTPRERADIETEFAIQARNLLHQLPGTTGSGPGDPVRKRAEVPLEGRVRAVEIEHVLDVHARNRNALPTAASFYISALERLRRQIASNVLVPNYLPEDKRHAFFFSQPLKVWVRSDKGRGTRPHINFLYAKYSSEVLGNSYELVDTQVLLRSDLRNIRTVMIFKLDGSLIGPAQALGRWGTFPHDSRMRQLFGQLKRAGQLGSRADDEPLEALFAHLNNKAPRNRKAALQLAYLVEYLTRNAVPLNPSMTQSVWDWEQLQHAKEKVQVLPVKPLAGAPLPALNAPQSPAVPASLLSVAGPSEKAKTAPPVASPPRLSTTSKFKPRPNLPL